MASFPRAAGSVGCSVEGCKGQATTRTTPQIHFVHHHMQYKIVIMEEGNLPHNRCPAWDMIIPWADLNRCQSNTTLFMQGAERKMWRLEEEEARAGAATTFQAYDQKLDSLVRNA